MYIFESEFEKNGKRSAVPEKHQSSKEVIYTVKEDSGDPVESGKLFPAPNVTRRMMNAEISGRTAASLKRLDRVPSLYGTPRGQLPPMAGRHDAQSRQGYCLYTERDPFSFKRRVLTCCSRGINWQQVSIK